MSEWNRQQLRLWLWETESDIKSVLNIEDPDEYEEDNLEILSAEIKDVEDKNVQEK